MGSTGEPFADGSRSGAITHRNDEPSVSTQRGDELLDHVVH